MAKREKFVQEFLRLHYVMSICTLPRGRTAKIPLLWRDRTRPKIVRISYVPISSAGCHTGNGEKLSRARSGNQLSCCLVSLHFLCDILSGRPVCTLHTLYSFRSLSHLKCNKSKLLRRPKIVEKSTLNSLSYFCLSYKGCFARSLPALRCLSVTVVCDLEFPF